METNRTGSEYFEVTNRKKIILERGGIKCAYLALMSARSTTPLGRDFKKIVLFSA